ncbi:sensor histidine kinase [Streptomyces spiralis]
MSAAAVRCEVRGQAGGLDGEVQSALGWVVREATTNVLRHGDAARCDIALDVVDRRVVLTVRNDGAADPAARGGSGLAGLRERLSAERCRRAMSAGTRSW